MSEQRETLNDRYIVRIRSSESGEGLLFLGFQVGISLILR